MKNLFLIFFLSFFAINISSQVSEIDSIFTHNYKYKDYTIYWNEDLVIVSQENIIGIDTIEIAVTDDGVDEGFSEPYHYESNFTLISIAGPYLSFLSSYMGYGGSSAHPSYGSNYYTYNLESKKNILLTDLWDENILLEKLIEVEIIRNHLNDIGKIEDLHINYLNDLIRYLGNICDSIDLESVLDNFAFYDATENEVFVQFGLKHCAEVYRGFFTEFEITLPMPKDKAEVFLKAKTEETLKSKWRFY
jgi:hypothetical protein